MKVLTPTVTDLINFDQGGAKIPNGDGKRGLK